MNTSDTAPPADEAAPDQQPQDQTAHDQQPDDQTAPDQQGGYRPPFDYSQAPPLHRPYEGRMLAGVAAGIGNYLGVDPTIVRIVLAVLTVAGGAGIPVYVAGWLLMPEEGARQSLASELISSFQPRSY